MNKVIFEGSCVAIVTPFKDGKVDYVSFKNLIEFQISNGTDAIVVLGTTGESSTMNEEEKKEVILFCNKTINKRVKMIVGTGSNNTLQVVKNSKFAIENGADALLIVTPYYNKCTQRGVIEHYRFIADAVHFPIIVYNVPGRTGVNIKPETYLELSKLDEICGIKEASGNIEQICEVCKVLRNKVAIYSGDDSLNYLFMSLGAKGCISVTANILPKDVSDLMHHALNGEFNKALLLHEKLFNLNKCIFVEVNPIPVKNALNKLNLCDNEVRLPLTNMEENNLAKLEQAMRDYGLI